MIKYLNLSGKSNVDSYEIESTTITVTFSDKAKYLYSYMKPGRAQVEKMKELAQKGEGLQTYISSEIKMKYEKKLR